jgi:hypothetical protein
MEFVLLLILWSLAAILAWALGAGILFVCSWGRIRQRKLAVNGLYERLPDGSIAVNLEVVFYFGAIVLMAVVASAFIAIDH